MRFLTDFADLAVVLPLALATAGLLLFAGWRRGAAVWAAGVGLVLFALLLLKLLVLGAGPFFPTMPLRSPSGHTAAGTVVYGGLLLLVLPRRVALAGAVLLAALFGATRLALHLHTLADTLLGAAAGLAGVAVMARRLGPRPPLSGLAPLLALLPLLWLCHGRELRVEPVLDAAVGRPPLRSSPDGAPDR